MKPYNPILGEQFYCKWDHDDSTTFFYSEQVSHHPPISALYMENRKYNWVYTSTTAPKSTFWTNKVEMTIDGEHILHLLTLDEKYVIQWPVVVGRGVLIGTSMVEHNHNLVITCAKTGLKTNIEMIKKSNDFKGTISKGKEDVYKLTGAFETKGIAEHIKSKVWKFLLFKIFSFSNKPNCSMPRIFKGLPSLSPTLPIKRQTKVVESGTMLPLPC